MRLLELMRVMESWLRDQPVQVIDPKTRPIVVMKPKDDGLLPKGYVRKVIEQTPISKKDEG